MGNSPKIEEGKFPIDPKMLLAALIFFAVLGAAFVISSQLLSSGKGGLATADIAPPAPGETTTFSECGIISSPGAYALGADIGGSEDSCINITAHNVYLDCAGHNISGQQVGAGINASGVENLTVANCSVSNFSSGILVSQSLNASILNNNVSGNIGSDDDGGGIWFEGCNSSLIANNSAYGDYRGAGIHLNNSFNNTLINNSAHGNREGIYLSGALYVPNNNTLINNIAYENSEYGFESYYSSGNIFINSSVYGNYEYGIFLNAVNNTFINTSIFSNMDGFYANYYMDNTIANDTHFFNNSQDDLWLSPNFVSQSFSLSNATFDNPEGNFENYTSIDMNATLTGLYRIKWSSGLSSAPADSAPFAHKFLRATSSYSTTVNYLAVRWEDAGSLDPATFSLWSYDGTSWANTSATLDEENNILYTTEPFTQAGGIGALGIYRPLACGDNISTYAVLASNYTCASNAFTLAGDGAVLDCAGNSITSSDATQQWIGINTSNSSGITVRNCTIIGYAFGIVMENTTRAAFSNNIILGNTSAGLSDPTAGITCPFGNTGPCANITISDNSISNYTNGAIYLGSDSSFDSNSVEGIIISRNNFTNLSSGSILIAGRGVPGGNGGDVAISGNRFTGQGTSGVVGVMLQNIARANVTGNTFLNSSGIFGFALSYSNISENVIDNDTQIFGDVSVPPGAIELGVGSVYNSISANNISNSTYGIKLSDFFGLVSGNNSNNAIFDNNISNCNYSIYLNASSNNNTFTNNTIANSLLAGIYIDNSTNTRISDTRIYNATVGISLNNTASGDHAGIMVIALSNLTLDNPLGTLENYTSFNLVDRIAPSTGYTISWAAKPAGFTGDNETIGNKFINITNAGSHVLIGKIEFLWTAEEVEGSHANASALLKYDGESWSGSARQWANPTEVLSLPIYNLVPSDEIYGVALTNTSPGQLACGDEFSRPGTYNLAESLACSGNGFAIIGSDVTLNCSGHEIDSTDPTLPWFGIVTADTDNVTVQNCTTRNYLYGFFASNVTNSRFVNNTLYGNDSAGSASGAIFCSWPSFGSYVPCENITVAQNTILNYTAGIAMGESVPDAAATYACSRISIDSNNISDILAWEGGSAGVEGIFFDSNITSNNITGRGDGVPSEAFLVLGSNLNISGNRVSDLAIGGYFFYVLNSIISANNIQNTFENGGYALLFAMGSSNDTISENVINNTGYGIITTPWDGDNFPHDMIFANNNISNAHNLSVLVDSSININFTNNSITSPSITPINVSNSANVLIDCAGNSLSPVAPASDIYGIYASGLNNLTVQNCTFQNFGVALLSGNITNSRFVSNAVYGDDSIGFQTGGVICGVSGLGSSTPCENLTISQNTMLNISYGAFLGDPDIPAPCANCTIDSNNFVNLTFTVGDMGAQGIGGVFADSNITNNNITGGGNGSTRSGIFSMSGSNNIVSGNRFSNLQAGVLSGGWHDSTFSGNNFQNILGAGADSMAIGFTISTGINVTENVINNTAVAIVMANMTGEGGFGAYNMNFIGNNISNTTSYAVMAFDSSNLAFTNNSITGANLSAFYLGAPNTTIDCRGQPISSAGDPTAAQAFAIFSGRADNLNVYDCNISGFQYGIWTGSSNSSFVNNTIAGNYGLENNSVGITCSGDGENSCYNVSYINNTITDFPYGLVLSKNNNSTVNGNTISNAYGKANASAMLISETTNTNITNNWLSNSQYGLYLGEWQTEGIGNSSGNSITHNFIWGCNYSVYVARNSSNNTFQHNSMFTSRIYAFVLNDTDSADPDDPALPMNFTATNNYWGRTTCAGINASIYDNHSGVEGVGNVTWYPGLKGPDGDPKDTCDQECDDAIGDSVNLSNDLECSGHGLMLLWGNDMTIDCKGHSLISSDAADGSSGIFTSEYGNNNLTIVNCTFINFDNAIMLYAVNNSRVFNNNIIGRYGTAVSNSSMGINLAYSSNVSVYSNNITNVSIGLGGQNSVVHDNNMGIFPGSVLPFSVGALIGANTTFENNTIAFYANDSVGVFAEADGPDGPLQLTNIVLRNNTINGSLAKLAAGIALVNATNSTVENNRIYNATTENWLGAGLNGAGIWLTSNSSSNNITGNYIESAYYGVSLASFDLLGLPGINANNRIISNNITGATLGIYVANDSYPNTYTYNNIQNSGLYAFANDLPGVSVSAANNYFGAATCSAVQALLYTSSTVTYLPFYNAAYPTTSMTTTCTTPTPTPPTPTPSGGPTGGGPHVPQAQNQTQNGTLTPPTPCASDSDCATSEKCSDGICTEITGACGIAINHAWTAYGCCADSACPSESACDMNSHQCAQLQTDSCSHVENHKLVQDECCDSRACADSTKVCSTSHTCVAREKPLTPQQTAQEKTDASTAIASLTSALDAAKAANSPNVAQYQKMLDAANKAYAAGNYAEAKRIASTAKVGLEAEAQQSSASKLPFGLSQENAALIGIAILILLLLAAGAFLLLKRGGKKKGS